MAEDIEDLEAQMGTRLLVIAQHESGELTLEENPFPGYVLVGIAAWLDMLGHEELLAGLEDDDEDDD